MKKMIEKDPNGKSPAESGAKLDFGKTRAALSTLSFGRALLQISDVTTFGANKYTPDGWREVPNAKERYMDAAFRHLLKMQSEPLDGESELPHLAHAVWNFLAVMELSLADE